MFLKIKNKILFVLFYTKDRVAISNGGWKQTENSWLKHTTAGSTLAWFVLLEFNLFLWTVSCFIRILSMVCMKVYELHVCINTQHLQHFIRIMFVVGMMDLSIHSFYKYAREDAIDRSTLVKWKFKVFEFLTHSLVILPSEIELELFTIGRRRDKKMSGLFLVGFFLNFICIGCSSTIKIEFKWNNEWENRLYTVKLSFVV